MCHSRLRRARLEVQQQIERGSWHRAGGWKQTAMFGTGQMQGDDRVGQPKNVSLQLVDGQLVGGGDQSKATRNVPVVSGPA